MFNLLRRSPQDSRGIRLEGRNLVLRTPVIEDWSGWAQLRSESREFLQPWEPAWPRDALTQTAFRRRLRSQARDRDAGTGCSFFVVHREDNTVMGGVTLSEIRRGVAQAATLGYWVGQRYARKGVMGEAIEIVVEHVFATLELHRLEAACLPVNEPSRRLLESRGFRMEGLAQSYLKIDGAWRDHLLFALIDAEWRKHKREQSAQQA